MVSKISFGPKSRQADHQDETRGRERKDEKAEAVPLVVRYCPRAPPGGPKTSLVLQNGQGLASRYASVVALRKWSADFTGHFDNFMMELQAWREGVRKDLAQNFWREAAKRGEYAFVQADLVLGFIPLLQKSSENALHSRVLRPFRPQEEDHSFQVGGTGMSRKRSCSRCRTVKVPPLTRELEGGNIRELNCQRLDIATLPSKEKVTHTSGLWTVWCRKKTRMNGPDTLPQLAS
ncbi:hypothetical protein C8R47DRAFT_1074630 [Mycena vitilis]|nr:hypothetical protein C8R47DRAFT_1074630 [Mycena vitilis]